ncbi:MAG: hypothetical protein U0998_12290, partial [Moraxellaceae bacterium]|nr:hypothetical protein [Moraxellaceae bacterium]
LGHAESYTYDKAGNRITLTNKNGDTWHYRYDELNRLSEEITPAVQVSSIATNGQVSTQTQLIVTRIEYDAAGNVTSRSEGRLRANLTSAPASDNIIHARTTNYAYDAVGRQTLITAPGWYNKTTGAYQLASSGTTSTFQVTTEVTYDALGNAVRNRVRINNTGTVADDFIDSYKTYDKAGRVVHEIDALNGVTAYSHDAVGNVLTIKRHANALNYAVPASGYYVASDITTARLVPDAANDRTMTMSYDAAGRKTSVQLDVVNVYITGLMLPFQGAPTTLFTYDAMGRVIKETQIVRDNGITLQTGASLHSYYDKVGNQIASVDALGYLTRNTYDALGQLTRSVEYNNKLSSWGTALPTNPSAHAKDRSTAYAYDRLGRLTTVTKENVTVWHQNITSGSAYSATVSMLNAVETTGNLVVDQRTYDKVGNLQTQRDAAGNLTTLAYNKLGQIMGMLEPQRLVAADVVNPFANNTANLAVAAPLVAYALNAFGQIISETRTPGDGRAGWITTIRTRYDQAGHEIEHIDAANASTHYKVDAAGRRIELRQQVSAQFAAWTGTSGYNHEIRQRYAYDKLGQQMFTQDYYTTVLGESFSSKSVLHNRFGEVYAEYSIGARPIIGATILQEASYTYDQAGRVILQENAQGTTTFDYDIAGRVTHSAQKGDGPAATSDRVTRTEYDASGRATRQYQPRFEANTGVNPLTSVTTSLVVPTITQTYDRWGNVLSRTDQRGYVTTYTYDHENRVLTETLPQTNILRADGTSYRASLIQERRYDALGKVLHEVDWVGPYTGMSSNTHLRTRTHAYNAVGELVRDIDALNMSRYYMVDANGNRVATRDALARVYINTFDAMDRQTTHGMMLKNSNDVLEHRILQTNKYDQAGRKYAEINGTIEVEETFTVDRNYVQDRGTTSYSVYDERGHVVRTRNESGVDRTYQFDEHNRKIRETHIGITAGQNNRYMTWSYDNNQYGRLSARRDLDGRQYAYTYNVYGQLAKESLNSAAGLDKTYEYYDNGMLKKVTEGVQTYNTNGTIRLQEKRSSTYVYDAAGNRVREIDATQTNLPSSPTTIRQSSSAETRYRYDEQGRLIGMFVPSGNTHLVGIANGSNNYTKPNSARINTLTYDYDEVGNRRRTLFNTTNQSSVTVNNERWYTYDKEDRVLLGDAVMIGGVIQYAWQNNLPVGYSNVYDAAGQLRGTYSSRGTGSYVLNGVTYNNASLVDITVFVYDDRGRMTDTVGQYVVRNSSDTQWLIPTQVKGIATGNVWVTNDQQTRMRASYNEYGDLLNNIVRTFKPDGTVDTLSATGWSYRGDGKAIYQAMIDESNGGWQKTFYNEAGMIDSQGNQLSYRVEFTGSQQFTNTYTNTYAHFDSSKIATTQVTSTRTGFTPGVTTNTYSQRGELMQVEATGGTPFIRQFAANREGLITSRRENAANKTQNYAYFQGAEVASYGNASSPEVRDAFITPWQQSDYVASRTSSYGVSQGDTLASIARMIWGDSRMWYLIADANGLAAGANDPLEAGNTLRIPAVAGSSKNNATTFKPYNPSDIIGETTPNPAAPPPPKPPKKKCGGLGAIVMVVVAVVAVVVTAGAAAVALGATGGGLFATGGAALAGGTLGTVSMSFGTALGASIIGGAVGSAISQGIGMAMGVVDKFSWRQVAAGGLGAGLSAGLGHFGLITKVTEGMNWSQAASAYAQNAAMSYSVNQISGRVAGLDTSFSWRSVASTVVGATVGNAAGRGLGLDGGNLWSGVARSVVTGSSQSYFHQQWA